jgi:hypothetical protein
VWEKINAYQVWYENLKKEHLFQDIYRWDDTKIDFKNKVGGYGLN